MSKMMRQLTMFTSNARAPNSKRPVRYSNGQGNANETAYEPYLHTGSEYDSSARPRNSSSRKSSAQGRRTGLRRFSVFCSVVSAAISLGIIGVSIEIILTLESSKTSRLLWPHNMMLQAWPLTGTPAIPTYVTVSAASAAALLNIILLLAVTFGRDGIYSSGVASAFGMATHVLLAAWFAAALVANGLYKPNLRSWACANGPFELSYKSNIVGLGKVCTDMFAVFISSLVAGAFEIFNALSVVIILLSERRLVRARGNFPKPANYQKLDPSTLEQDEVPMLEVSRKSIQEDSI